MTSFPLLIAFLLLCHAAGAALYATESRHVLLVTEEDNLTENLTVVFHVCAACLGIRAWRVIEASARPLVGVVIVIALLCALDELSFGERLFHLHMPVVKGVKIDAIHDFISLAYENPYQAMPMILIPLLIVAYRFRAWVLNTMRGWKQWLREPRIFLLFFGISVSVAAVLDLEIVEHGYCKVLEELLEFGAAASLMMFLVLAGPQFRAEGIKGEGTPSRGGSPLS